LVVVAHRYSKMVVGLWIVVMPRMTLFLVVAAAAVVGAVGAVLVE
jgi:hypothetical protein